jgi:ParB family chromosome partitioning protein
MRGIEDGLEELVENIRVHGQLEAIVVAKTADQMYEVVTGQRRFLAHKRLGRTTIMAAILKERVDEVTAKVLSISENLIRKDLNAKDIIDTCTALHQKYGSLKAVSEELGLPYHRVRTYVMFERLRPDLKDLVSEGFVDIKTALATEDALAEVEPGDGIDARSLAQSLSSLSRAQQIRAIKNASVKDLRKLSSGQIDGQDRRIAQVIVTLPTTVHAQLQAWAREHAVTQDEAAAGMIIDALRDSTEAGATEAAGLNDHPTGGGGDHS